MKLGTLIKHGEMICHAHIVFPVRLSVRHKSCLLYNSKTVKDISMKLDTLIKHDETMCHAQEP